MTLNEPAMASLLPRPRISFASAFSVEQDYSNADTSTKLNLHTSQSASRTQDTSLYPWDTLRLFYAKQSTRCGGRLNLQTQFKTDTLCWRGYTDVEGWFIQIMNAELICLVSYLYDSKTPF